MASLGGGAHHVVFFGGNLEIKDFDPAEDLLLFHGVDALGDVDQASEDALGVTLIVGSATVRLDGVTLAELSADYFSPWLY